MKSGFRILLAVIVGAFLLASCIMYYPPRQSTPESLEDSDPMAMIEKYATATAVAKTEMAKPENAPAALSATAFAVTRRALPLALVIVLPDGSRKDFTYPELENYATLTLDIFDAPRKVVDLRLLLEEADWVRYPIFSITIEGRTSMTFHVERLPKDAALYLENGTINFVSGEVPAEDWPRDVVLIIVR